jgi:thymidylate kinase
MVPMAEALLYAAALDMCSVVSQVIKTCLERGKIVVCD